MQDVIRETYTGRVIEEEVLKGESENEILLAALVTVSRVDLRTSIGVHKAAYSIQESRWTEAVTIKEIEQPQSWRLVRVHENGTATDEEVVFTVYGMLKAMDLLPFKINTKISGKRIKFLKQSVQLEGLGSRQFCDAMEGAKIVCQHFASEFAEGRLERWEDAYAGQEEQQLNLANRIFTPLEELGEDDRHQPLGKELDPYNVTDKIVQKGFAVTDDNIVQYSRAVTETKDGHVTRRRVNLSCGGYSSAKRNNGLDTRNIDLRSSG
ncbi:hypothetical protein H0H93_011535, partial [Arthromyces matolae]